MDKLKHRQLWADVLLLLVTLVWGSTFVMVKDAVAAYPVFPFLTLRFGLATLALLALGWRRLKFLGWKGWGAGILIGLFLMAGYSFQTVGLQYTTASKAGFITGLSVVIVPILSAVLLRRLPSIETVMGVVLAVIGLALLTLNQALDIQQGDLIVLGCALSFALHIVAVSAFAPQMDPLALTIVQVATVAVASAGISLATSHPLPAPAPATWFATGFTGLLATAVAFGLQTSMQRFTTPTHTALIFAAEPVFAALFGVLLAGDIMTNQGIAGGILIVAGTVASEINWSPRTGYILSRFLGPNYVLVPLIFILGICDPASWQQGLLWSGIVGMVGIGVPLGTIYHEVRQGRISDWHISNRSERLHPRIVAATMIAAIGPVLLLALFHGPRLLLVACLSALFLAVTNLLITVVWKISQHVSGVAATATLITAALGMWISPILLLIPLVAWARVKVGAHTVGQTLAGGFVGVTIPLLTLRLLGLA